MTGNKAHLADYQEFKGGFVAFRSSNERITGKEKIKAGRDLGRRLSHGNAKSRLLWLLLLHRQNMLLLHTAVDKFWNYMPSGPDVEIDYTKFTYGPKQTSVDVSNSKPNEYASCESDSIVETTTSMPEPVENAPKVVCEPKVWTDAPIIEEYESDSDNDLVSNVQEDKEKPSFPFTDSVKHVKTSRENVKESGTHNHSPKIKKQDRNGHTRKGLGYAFTRKACFVCGEIKILLLRPQQVVIGETKEILGTKSSTTIVDQSLENDNPHQNLNGKGIVDSRCSRHITGNKAYLVKYQDFNGGHVAFGGSKDTECLVLSPDFKLPDENQVLFRVPKQNNMYSFNLENIVPSGGDQPTLTESSSEHDSSQDPRVDLEGTAEGSLNLKALSALCTNLSNKVLALETVKDAQAKEILTLNARLKKMEKRCKLRPTKDESDKLDAKLDEDMEYMDTKEVLNEGRESTDDTARPDVSTARQELSTAGPTTTPTTSTIIDDEEMTLADTLIKLKDDKAKGVAFKDSESTDRHARSILTLKPLPTIDPKDKGKGVLEETKFTHSQLNKKSFEDIQGLYMKEHELITDFVPIGSKEDERMIRDMNKKAKEESSDKDPDEERVIDYEVLDKRFPIINWVSKFYHYDKHGVEGIYYRIFRSDGSSRWIKTFSEMVTRFDRLNLVELYNLVMQRFESTTPEDARGVEIRLTVEIVGVVLASGVDLVLVKDFALFALQIKDYRNEKIDIHFRRECENMIDELKVPPSNAITPVLPTIENPEDFLVMENEELSTILEKKSDEFIKSSVEDLVPILRESEDTFGSDSECDLSSCDDFSPINVSEEKSMTFFNPLFDLNDDFTSSDDKSLSNEDVPEDNVKIYSNPLFEFDDEYISSDVNLLFDEVLEDIKGKIKDYRNEKIDIHFRRECENMIDELKVPPSNAITPVLPTIENPEDFLVMENEELSTILEKKSDEFIKSSVEDLVPILRESEDTFGSDSECDLSSCDDFSPINVSEEKSMTFSNPLFDLNDDFTSSDDKSLSNEDVPEDNVKIYSNPLFEFDDEYISSDVNLLFDEVLEDIKGKVSYDSNLDEPTLLVTPLSDANEDECLNPGGDVDEIELLLHRDPSTPKMSIASILEGFTDEPPLEDNDDLFDLEYKENK
nr:hypothetical protein [Tanacetum cinerariifolium]